MGDDDHHCRRYPSEDRISGLPDELLLDILTRLGCTRAAARTSVLSSRWRHVWPDVPELILDGGPDAPPPSSPASFLDIVDAALDAHTAPTIQRLHVAVSDADAVAITSGRAASWLRFAAERVAGTLSLLVPLGMGLSSSLLTVAMQELGLPVCSRAKSITLQLRDTWRLRPPPAGVFSVLTALAILFVRMEGSELTALVSTQCPCLRDLKLSLSLVHVSDVSIHSDTLRSLQLSICNSWQVEVITPRLEKLRVYDTFMGRISAPKLLDLFWTGVNDNATLQFVGRHLRLLEIVGLRSIITKPLLQQFDEVEELKLFMFIPKGREGYQSFLNQINKLPVCKTLNVSLLDFNHHGLATTLLHLLNTCNSTTKEVYVQLIPHDYQQQYFCPSSCPCRLLESDGVDFTTLSSLEEITICSHSNSYEEFEFVQQLSKCNAASLKKLVTVHDNGRFHVHMESNEVTEKIRSLYPPNVKVEFYVIRHGKQVL